MQYILLGLVILYIISKVGKKEKPENEDVHTEEQKQFYKGRKTENDWNIWYDDILKHKS